MTDSISLRGVRVHNLRGIDVDIPLRKLTVISGVSGAGKSSLAFDTLYAEAQRRYLQSFSAYTRQFLERFDQPDADHIGDLPPAVAVRDLSLGRGARATVGTVTEIFDYLRLLLARFGTVHCLTCQREIRPQKSADVLAHMQGLPAGTRLSIAFQFDAGQDSRRGVRYSESRGSGVQDHDPDTRTRGVRSTSPRGVDEVNVRLDHLKEEGFVRVQIGDEVLRLDQGKLPDLEPPKKVWVLVDRVEAGKTPPERVTDSLETAFNRGGGRLALLEGSSATLFDQRLICPHCEMLYPDPEPGLLHFNDPRGACPVCQGTGMDTKAKKAAGLEGSPHGVCATCHGSRLSEQTGYLLWQGKSLADLCRMTLTELERVARVDKEQDSASLATSAEPLLSSIRARLGYLLAVELGYLNLQRSTASLSTGEARRVRLTAALGSNLVNALYVFDEPTAGLHPRDTGKLLAELLRLRSAGNTLVMVEHDAEVLAAADHVIDLGPGAGEEGGQVLYQGTPGGLLEDEGSLTGQYLAGGCSIPVPQRRRSLSHGSLKLVGASCNNLQDLTIEFPLGVLCVVTGVSGAGKNSLVQHSLHRALVEGEKGKNGAVHGSGQINEVVLMDQEPLARTARSNPATYLKVFDDIRKLFAETTDARIRNFTPGHFSFNQPGGRCETCAGQGNLNVDMQFLADVSITCPECQGTRFKKEILDVKVRSLSIAEVLNLTAREAFRFFRAQATIERRLKYLLDVGLDYLRLGQPTDTLSGGECPRLKLAGHLASSRKTRCLFLLLEPTIGLHPDDVARLLGCFDHLLEAGHSLVVVEHNLDVIKCADHVIDLGPGAGPDGGRVVAVGTPEEVAQVEASATGRCLQQVLRSPLANP